MLKRQKDDHAIFELRDHNGRKQLKVTTPSKILPIGTIEELRAQLDHYSRGILHLVVPDSKFARRHYVEKIRPALRYYCTRFGVPIPGWLKDDSRYTQHLNDTEKERLFGTSKLHVREFTKVKQPQRAA